MDYMSNSQAGQDLWVLEQYGATPGTFLDIGCSHPVQLSNTYLLERLGWRGWLIDVDHNAIELCRQQRPSSVAIEGDATAFDWTTVIPAPWLVDYLSLDIDHGSLAALENLLRCGVTFKIATIEHDAYRFGDELRAGQRQLLEPAGYVRVRADVCCAGYPQCPFEDWWVCGALSEVCR